jgi:hypothetical protein
MKHADLIKRLIKEALSKPLKEDKCNCGCHSCENVGNKGPVLNESLGARILMTENMQYHVKNKLAITENTFRYGSQAFLDLWAEARYLYSRNAIHLNDEDKEIILETNLGEYGMYEGKKVPLDLPMLEEDEEELNIGDIIKINPKEFPNFEFPYGTEGEIEDINKADYASDNLVYTVKIKYIDGQGDETNTLHIENSSQYLNETEKKKTPPIGKPKRGGSKKFYVYVRDKGKIKKVSFGDTSGLSVKINNPEARRAFAARHDCKNKKDRTKPSYWSCNVGRYAKQLGLGSNFYGYW